MKPTTLDAIYRSHFKDIYCYSLALCQNHYDAEDLVQETFYRAYLYLEDCPERQVKPWLFKVAHNAFIDSIRKRGRNQLENEEFFQKRSDFVSPESEFIKRELLQSIAHIIKRLPENQKQAILLCDYCALTYEEAADIMGIRLGNLKVLLFRARQKVRQEKGEND